MTKRPSHGLALLFRSDVTRSDTENTYKHTRANMELNNQFTVTHGAPPLLEASVTDRCPASKMRQRRETTRTAYVRGIVMQIGIFVRMNRVYIPVTCINTVRFVCYFHDLLNYRTCIFNTDSFRKLVFGINGSVCCV